MNPLALVVFFLVGFFGSWKLAFVLLGGYLMAFLLIGLAKGWNQR